MQNLSNTKTLAVENLSITVEKKGKKKKKEAKFTLNILKYTLI